MNAPQPSIGNRVTFLRDGEKIEARIQSVVLGASVVVAVTGDGTSYLVRNDEILRLVTDAGVYGKLENGGYRFSVFCKRNRRR
jgi:hypothetical protein